jgi:class 3 adenylate cyclase
MHREFRELLDGATGETDFVIALNLDIRGFSAWSRRVESPMTTLYLMKIYPKLIDRYFADQWFFKPTGDGLLLVRPFVESELAELAESVLRSCFEIVDRFGTLCDDEPMVNFEVPQEVGIGIAQGAASRLVSGGRTLDYSGRVLNLASRLMELARPRGVVIDSGFGQGLLPSDLSEGFASKTGFIRGVSPDDGITILYDPDLTEIPESFTKRPGDITWRTVRRKFELRELERLGGGWRFTLDEEPADPEQIKVSYSYPALLAGGRQAKDRSKYGVHGDFRYAGPPDGPLVVVRFVELAKRLRRIGVKGPWIVDVKVDYPL